METRADDIATEWARILEQSEAEIAAGEVEPLEPVLERLRSAIARMGWPICWSRRGAMGPIWW